MKTAAYTLQEEQIEWLKKKAILEQGTASQILRRVLREAMERDGYNPLFVSTETVNITASSAALANPEN